LWGASRAINCCTAAPGSREAAKPAPQRPSSSQTIPVGVDGNGMSEVMSEASERLNGLEPGDVCAAGMEASQAERVPECGDLVDQIRDALAPQKPAPLFRRMLRRELVEMAQGHPDKEVSLAEPSTYRELIIGAAIGSAVALAGGIVYLLRMREPSRGRPMSEVRLEQIST